MDHISDFRSMRIGDVLKELGYATDEQIAAALDYQKANKGVPLGQALLQLGVISEKQMLTALGISTGLPIKEPSQITVDLDAAAQIPEELAKRYQMLPIQADAGILTILTNDPFNFYGQEDIRQITGMDLELCLCEAEPLSGAIRYYYSEIAARKAVRAANNASRFPEDFSSFERPSESWRRQSEALRREIGMAGISQLRGRPENGLRKKEKDQANGSDENQIVCRNEDWLGIGNNEDQFGIGKNEDQLGIGKDEDRFGIGKDEDRLGIGKDENRFAVGSNRDRFDSGNGNRMSSSDKDRSAGRPEEEAGEAEDGGRRSPRSLVERLTGYLGPDEEDTPIIKLLNQLIQRAYRNNASDIHIEPQEDRTVVRMRLDGAMAEFVTLQKRIHLPLIARIKILGDMDIAERRFPQDGHFRTQIDGETVNTRVSVIPTVYGEKAVIRLLSGNRPIEYADTFGMNQQDYQKLRQMLDAPNGLIYLTGPTGSGKTTTLYLVLQELAKRPVNICTIEDPVEKNLSGISQCQVNQKKGLTFETGLRAILRQDPDIIMIGETRDKETAAISVRAAITGHLVLSTLHTNDAASSIIRLKDMGVEPYLTANSLVGAVAQRLLRKLCPDCARTVDAAEGDWKLLGRTPARIRVPVGCPSCNGTGYRGRVAVHEILTADKTVRSMIAEGVSVEEIRKHAIQVQGMRTLKECAAQLVEQGITSMDELKKAAYYNEMG